MSTEYNPENNIRIEEESALNLWDLFQIFKANWYWFVLSVIPLCGSGLFIPASSSPGVYTYRFGSGKRRAAQEPCCHDLWFYRFGYVRFAAKCG